jgi:lipopolysaccharide export system permease protein
VILEFLGLSVPFTIAMTLPMAVLVAVLYAFSRLAAENEITAMKASGVSMWTVLGPVILFGFVMSLVMLAFNDQVLPRANHRLAVLQLDIFRTKPTFALREQVLNPVKEGQLYLRAANIDEGTSRMRDVTIYDHSDQMRRRTIYADSGFLALASNRRDLEMTLYDGVMMTVPNRNTTELTRMFFKRDRLRVKGVLNEYQESQGGNVSRGDREMSICEMQAQVRRADLLVRQARYDSLYAEAEASRQRGDSVVLPAPPTTGTGTVLGTLYCNAIDALTPKKAQAQDRAPEDDVALKARINEATFRTQEARRERNRYDVEIQKKFSLAAACVIFVLIGAPVALRFPRGGVGLVIGVSFAIFGLYYVGLIGGETLADKDFVPPWIAMWAMNIGLLTVGLILAARMGRESSTQRGGDWGELMATVRTRGLGWLRRVGIHIERRRK